MKSKSFALLMASMILILIISVLATSCRTTHKSRSVATLKKDSTTTTRHDVKETSGSKSQTLSTTQTTTAKISSAGYTTLSFDSGVAVHVANAKGFLTETVTRRPTKFILPNLTTDENTIQLQNQTAQITTHKDSAALTTTANKTTTAENIILEEKLSKPSTWGFSSISLIATAIVLTALLAVMIIKRKSILS